MSVLQVLLLAISFGGCWAALPQGWQTCKMSASDYNDCLIKAIHTALKSLKNGNKQFGLIPIDPLRIPLITMNQGTGPVSLKLQFKDMDVMGLSRCQVQKVKNDWKKIDALAICKDMSLIGKYKGEGKILSLPITGEGDYKIDVGETIGNLHGEFNEIEKGGKKYFDLVKYDLKMSTKNVTFNFENLFNGNKELSDHMNRFMNQNSDIIMEEVGPILTKAFSKAHEQVAKQIFSKIPSSEINIK